MAEETLVEIEVCPDCFGTGFANHYLSSPHNDRRSHPRPDRPALREQTMTILYSCRHDGDQYRITKFSHDMNVESSYLCTETECDCPAGRRPRCRHREMLPKFIYRGHVGDEWFFDYDRGGWVQMDLREPERGPREDAPIPNEQMPERLIGPDCKSGALRHDGSNPSLLTKPYWRRY